MSIKSKIKSLKETSALIKKQVALEQAALAQYATIVAKYKALCKHDVTDDQIIDAVEKINKSWHTYLRVKNANNSSTGS